MAQDFARGLVPEQPLVPAPASSTPGLDHQVIPYTFEQNVDTSLFTIFYFVMPDGVSALRSAKIWTRQLAYRTQDSMTFPGATTGAESAGVPHTHGYLGVSRTVAMQESGGVGTNTIAVANDGVTYGAAIASGVTDQTGLSLTGITSTAGIKAVRLTASAVMRVQAVIVLDCIFSVGL